MLSYLFTSSVLLFVFAVGYYALLGQAPALALRRRVLMLGILAAALLPLCPTPDFSEDIITAQPVHESLEAFTQQYEATTTSRPAIPTAEAPHNNLKTTTTFWYPGRTLLVVYLLGVLLLLGKVMIGLVRLARLHHSSTATGDKRIRVIKAGGDAFTFGPTVYLSQAVYDAPDADVILTHELAHADQWHTLDALLAEVTRAVFWFNPMAWWIREQVQLNLEYLADATVLAAGYDKKDYQLSLVAHQQGVDFRTSLLPQFAAKGLKRRIQMMSFRAGSQVRSWVATAGLVLVAFVAFTVTNGKAQPVGNDNYSDETTVPITNSDILYNGEAHELNIYFKRMPYPAEVAIIKEELKYFYNRDFYVFRDCTDSPGTLTFAIGNPNKLTHQVKIAEGEETPLPRRFQLKKDGKGGSGGAVFRPQPLPEGAPDTDVFYNLDGNWVSVEINPAYTYTDEQLTTAPVSASINCQLELNADNYKDYSIGKNATVTPIFGSSPEEYVNSYIEGWKDGSGTKIIGIKYFLAEQEVGLTEFYRAANASGQRLTLARRMNEVETLFVVRLDRAQE